MTARVEVYRQQPDDWESQRAVRLAALADAPSAFITTVAEATEYPEALWRERLATNPHLVVEVDGSITGMAVVLLDREPSPEVVGVWVDPRARGTGAIDALLDAILDEVRRHGSTEVRLWVVDGNERAEAAYLRNGYHRTGASQPVPGRPDEHEIELARAVENSPG